MFESLLPSIALPDLHPAVVHYPIALLTTAFVLDVFCLVLRSQPWLDRAATLLYVLGTLSACAAVISGQQAADLLVGAPGAAQAAMYDHEDLAKLTLVMFGIVASLRLIASWRARRDKKVKTGALRVVAVVLAFCGQFLILLTASRGGELVYFHGLGTNPDYTVEETVVDDELLEP
jgi:uncharacterized membrane protein